MSIRLIAYVLLALGALVVVLTRVRLRRENAAGIRPVPTLLLNAHTLFGVLGLGAWLAYVLTDEDSKIGVDRELLGIGALSALWVVSICGLLILMRWLPSRGRHASDANEDSWSEGPGLSVLAHVGMFLAICFDTVVYMLDQL
ncbi:MAG: hypothetical protein U0R80_08945 [Nocardioidaceae bacterium]